MPEKCRIDIKFAISFLPFFFFHFVFLLFLFLFSEVSLIECEHKKVRVILIFALKMSRLLAYT